MGGTGKSGSFGTSVPTRCGKYIPFHGTEEPRAFREAIHSRRVEHPNVVRVFDAFREENQAILRMEYVPGRDLFRVVREDGILDPREVVRIGLQTAGALEAAHGQGIVHLDLKPQNLILREDGQVMLTDFGISASIRSDGGKKGIGRGTPYFMAPEQIDGRAPLEPPVDVWGFGVSMYFLLSGEYPFPFDDRDYREVILGEEPISLLERQPVLDRELWGVLEGCLNKDPAARYRSMRDVADALASIRDELVCLACHQRVRRDHDEDVCPLCQWSGYGKQVQADEIFLGGQVRYANSDFLGAGHCFKDIERECPPELEPIGERARECYDLCVAASEELRQKLADVRALIKADQFLESFREVRACPPRFSRSKDRKDLEAEILQEIRRRCSTVRGKVEVLVREAEFDLARKSLEEVEAFLEHAPLRALLLEEEEEDTRGYTGSTSEIYRTIADREETCLKHTEAAEEALQRLDFETAKKELGVLYHWFHGKEHLERIRDLNRAAESLEIVHEQAFLHMDQLVREQTIPSGLTLELHTAHRHCSELLRRFPPESYPLMQQYQECRDQLEGVVQEFRNIGLKSLAKARKAEREGSVVDALSEIERVSGILLRTDLFSRTEQDEARRILNEARERTQKAQMRQEEGIDALRARRYAQAIASFEEASRLDPRREKSLSPHLDKARESSTAALRLADEVQPLYYTLVNRPPRLADVLAFMRRTASLCQLQDESAARESRARLTEVFGRGLASASARLRDMEQTSDVQVVFLELKELFDEALEQRLLPVVLPDEDVQQELHVLVELALDKLVPRSSTDPEARLAGYDALMTELEHWGEFLRAMMVGRPVDGEDGHPMFQVLDSLRHETDHLPKGDANQLEYLARLRRCAGRALDLLPAVTLDRVEKLRATIRMREHQLRIRRSALKVVGLAVSIGAPILLALGVGWGTWKLANRSSEFQATQQVMAEFREFDEGEHDGRPLPFGYIEAERIARGDRADWDRLTYLTRVRLPEWRRTSRELLEFGSWEGLESQARLERSIRLGMNLIEEIGGFESSLYRTYSSPWEAKIREALSKGAERYLKAFGTRPVADRLDAAQDPMTNLKALTRAIDELARFHHTLEHENLLGKVGRGERALRADVLEYLSVLEKVERELRRILDGIQRSHPSAGGARGNPDGSRVQGDRYSRWSAQILADSRNLLETVRAMKPSRSLDLAPFVSHHVQEALFSAHIRVHLDLFETELGQRSPRTMLRSVHHRLGLLKPLFAMLDRDVDLSRLGLTDAIESVILDAMHRERTKKP